MVRGQSIAFDAVRAGFAPFRVVPCSRRIAHALRLSCFAQDVRQFSHERNGWPCLSLSEVTGGTTGGGVGLKVTPPWRRSPVLPREISSDIRCIVGKEVRVRHSLARIARSASRAFFLPHDQHTQPPRLISFRPINERRKLIGCERLQLREVHTEEVDSCGGWACGPTFAGPADPPSRH